MARPPSNDIAHEQVTDHWIKKRVSQERLPLATSGELVTVDGAAASDRDLGLAYAQMAARGDHDAGVRALALLRKAETEAKDARNDHEVHSRLGFLEQIDGQTGDAEREYRAALAADSFDALAAGDLALIEAQRKNTTEPLRLWRDVFANDPTQLRAGMNLAITECAQGDRDAALATLDRMLEFSPDDGAARSFAEQIRSGRRTCALK
jgi:tetratricopeptide (TPR) repeat protein